MIYFRDNENEREKYEITFNRSGLQELRKTIAIKFGEHSTVNKEITRSDVPLNDYFTWDGDTFHYYIGVKYSKSGNTVREYDHYDSYDEDLYNCTYNEYICPKFVLLIHNILLQEPEAIEHIFNHDFDEYMNIPKISEKIALVKEEIKELNQKSGYLEEQIKILQSWSIKIDKELLNIEKEYALKIKELNKRLNYLLSIEKLNEKQEDISKYIDELLSLIQIKLVDTISLDLIDRVKSFESNEVPRKEAQLVKRK